MSSFLLLSGYLLNINKAKRDFLKSVCSVLYPYLFFEIIYLGAISVLGEILESSNQSVLSISSLIEKIILSPMGIYWYLHTLIICMCVYFIVNKLWINNFNILVITGCILYLFSILIFGFHWGNVIYFLIGCSIKKYGWQLKDVIFPSALSVIPIFLISVFSQNFHREDLPGLGLTILMLSFCIGFYYYLPCCVQKIYK